MRTRVGTSRALAKTLALPMFCLTVFLSRLLAFRSRLAWLVSRGQRAGASRNHVCV